MKKVLTILFCLFLSFGQAPGQLWRTMGGGVDFKTFDITSDSAQGLLYVAGSFNQAGGLLVAQLATWDGNNWGKVGNYPDPPQAMGIDAQINSALHFENHVFVGGFFTWDNSVYVGEKYAYKFDGVSWDTCGNPSGTAIFDVINRDLFVFGQFRWINGLPATAIARWNGVAWVPFGDPIAGYSPSYFFSGGEYYKGNYYFGGNFEDMNHCNEILYWDGNAWLSPGTGVHGQAWVDRLKAYKGLLYVGGYFHAASGNAGDMLMTWNGTDWQPCFPAVHYDSQLYDLEVIDGKLYFVAWHHVWDGTAWRGPFSIGRYDGQQFCSFGGITQNEIQDIAGLKGEIYATFSHPIFQGDSIHFVAQWMGGNNMDVCVSDPTSVAPPFVESMQLYPNPSHGSFALELPSGVSKCKLRILDIAGREVLPSMTYLSGTVDVTMLPTGLYFVEVNAKTSKQVIKLVKE